MCFLVGHILLALIFCTPGFCSGFSYTYESYTCPNALTEAVNGAVDQSLALGRKPILVFDIDETKVKETIHNGASYTVPTQFSMLLEKSLVYAKAYAVMALSARQGWMLEDTKSELSICCPSFYSHMTGNENFGGTLASHREYLDSSVGYVYQWGLLIVGDKRKRAVFDAYFQENPIEQAEYTLIFVDNDLGWFEEFLSGAYPMNVRHGYFFHHDEAACESIIFNPIIFPTPVLPPPVLPLVPRLNFSALTDEVDEVDDEKWVRIPGGGFRLELAFSNIPSFARLAVDIPTIDISPAAQVDHVDPSASSISDDDCDG